MKKSEAKDIVLSIVGVILLIVMATGASYSAFVFSKEGIIPNTINSGTISFTYNEDSNGISITNAIPMTDGAGKILTATDSSNGVTQGFFDFSVSGSISGNASITYEVYGTIDSSSTMDPNHVKVYLTDGSSSEIPYDGYDGEVVPVYGGLPVATSDPNSKRIYTDTFNTSTLSKKFRLRLWVADTYTVTDVSKTFIMRVNVSAVN